MQLVVVASLIALANAGLSIVSFATVKAGTKQTIFWTYDGKPEIKSIDIDVVTGDANSLRTAASVASDVDPKKLSYDWTVPNNLQPNTNYTIRFQGRNPAGNKAADLQFYNAAFTVTPGEKVSGAAKFSVGTGALAAIAVAFFA
jgi:hypothetical protein